MQKRVVGNINELNEAARKTASEESANTAGADRGDCKANKTSFGRFKKFAVIVMLLIVSVFCAIGSADWIISQQKQLPGGSGSTFVYDKKTLQNYIALKGSDETEAVAKVAEAEEYASLQTETDSDDRAVTDKFTVKKAAVSKKTAVSTYANGLESVIYGKSAIYNGKPIVAVTKASGIDNAAAELPDEVLSGSLLTSYKPLTDGSVTEADLTEADFAKGATSGLPQNAGTYAILVKIKGLEAYGYAVKIFTILPCPVTVGWSGIDFANGFTYDGAAHPVTVAAKIASSDNGNIEGNKVNANLSISITKNGAFAEEIKTAGNYVLTAASGNDNYVIYDTEATRTASFTVKPAPLTVTVNDKTITYGDAVPGFTLSYEGFVGGETASVLGGTAIFTHGYKQFFDAKTYTVTASGLTSENYKITYNQGTLTVIKYGLDIEWSDTPFTYNKTAHVPTAAITNPLPSGAADYGLNVSVITGEAINAGSYTAKASVPDDGNYYISSGETTKFTVTAKEATATVILSETEIVFGSEAPTATINYSGVISGDSLGTPEFDYGGYKKGSDVRTYTVTVKGLANGNYDITTTSASFTVKPYGLNIKWSDTTFTYNKAVQKPVATISNPIEGLTAPTVTVTTYSETGVAADSINAGSYTAKASVADTNYYIVSGETANFTVAAKKATAAVTLSQTEIAFGSEAPTATINYSGVISGDSLGTPEFDYGGYKKGTSPAGKTYTVTVISGLANDNYDIKTTSANFTVKPYGLNIEWSDTDLKYTGKEQKPKATIKNPIEGLIAPDVNVTTYISGNDTPISASAVGKYIAKASVSDGNYSISSGETTDFTISRIQVAIPTSGNNMLEYTGSQLTYTPSGFDGNTMTITGNTGSYITEDAYKAEVSLKDIYEWSDKTTETKTFAWYIVPKLVKFDGILEKTYEEAKTGITLDANVFTNLVFKNGEKANTQATGAASTIKVTDGNGNDYTETSPNNVVKVGSTYKAEIKLVNNYCFDIQVDEKANKCTFNRNGTTYIKYKTAKIGKTYYTIEDALAVSGDIILAGDSSSYVTTAFSNLKLSSSVDSAFSDYKSNYAYTLNKKTLTVPYDSNGTAEKVDEKSSDYGNVYSALVIHKNIILTISSSNLIAAAHVGFNQSISTTLVNEHGVIMNNGKIIVESGEIKAYGYIKGGDSGLIELKSGTTTLDALSIYDWPGGRAGLSMCSSVFPTNAYTLHNISCPTKIYSGAIYKARVFLNATTNLDETIIVIGIPGDTKSEGMFNADDSTGYILKSVTTNAADKNTNKDINYNITSSNQRASNAVNTLNHRDNIIVNGNYSDSPIKISKVIFTIQTSTSIPLPVGFMDITVNNGAKLTLTSSDYLLLPGSTLKVESGGILNLGSKVDIVAMPYSSMPTGGRGYLKYYTSATDGSGKHDGKLIINGTLTGSGYNLGGKILTESAGATLKVVNTSGSYITMTETSSPYYQSGTVNSAGNIMTGANSYANRSLGSGTFYSKIVDGEAVWYSETADILFNADGNIVSTIQKAVGANGYTIQSSDFPSTPTMDFYTFEDWYLDENCTVKALGQTIFASTTLYAGWTPVSYNITYKFIYNGNEITDGITNDKNRTSYTYEDSFFLSPATYLDEYKFYRWYTDSSLGSPITQISGMHGDLTLYGEFINKNDKTYNITYSYVNVNTDTEVSTPPATASIKSNAVATFIPANFDSYNANTNKNKYFDGWYTDKSCTAEYKFTSLSEYIEGLEVSENTDVNITLYGKWVNKLELYIGLGDLEYKSGKYYYLQGTTLTLPDISKYEELTSLINFKEKYPSDKYKFLGFTSDPSGCTAEAVYKTDSNGYITEIETKVTIGDLSEIIANNGKLKVSADMREILAVDITMRAYKKGGFFSSDKYFSINTFKITSKDSFYAINDVFAWKKSNGNDQISELQFSKDTKKLYIIEGTTNIEITVNNVNTSLISNGDAINDPEYNTIACSCSITKEKQQKIFNFTITGNTSITWNKQQ